MNLFSISWKNVWHKPLNTLLSLLLVMLGTGMIAMLLFAGRQFEDQLFRNTGGVDMVLGAKGSPLQIILSSLYHIDSPTGNIAYEEAMKIGRNPMVESSIPISYGDNWKGYRILGTLPAYRDLYNLELARGDWWSESMDITIGSEVAERAFLTVGDVIHSVHGLAAEGQGHEAHPMLVTGIMRRSGTVADQLILTSLESIWDVHAHGHENEDVQDSLPLETGISPDRKITNLLVKFRNPVANLRIPRMVNEKTSMQAALPSIELDRLLNITAAWTQSMQLLAWLIMLVAALSIFIVLLGRMRARRSEWALLRSMGMPRIKIFFLMLLEGQIIGFSGFLAGMLLSRLGMFMVAAIVRNNYRYDLDAFYPNLQDVYLLVIVALLAFAASLFPAILAMRTNISEELSGG